MGDRRGARALGAVLALLSAGSASTTYVVRRGDTLAAVAARNRVPLAAIAQANGIADVHRIDAGARLVLPDGATARTSAAVVTVVTTHLVVRGDTLEGIARRHGTSVRELAGANRMSPSGLLRVGVRLAVPGATATALAGGARLPARLRARPDRLALRPRFRYWAAAYGVPHDLLEAVTWVESGWQNSKVSATGARGIGQLMPDTIDFVSQRLVGVRLDPRSPDDNIRMSARFLSYLLGRTGGRLAPALAAYYQGLRSVTERGALPESLTYVATVLAVRPLFSVA